MKAKVSGNKLKTALSKFFHKKSTSTPAGQEGKKGGVQMINASGIGAIQEEEENDWPLIHIF